METSPIEFSSERIEIAKALLRAQGQIGPLIKSETNPLYNSKYADLSAVIDVIKGPLHEAGIVLLQGASVQSDHQGGEQKVFLETTLVHAESGQWVRNVLTLVPIPDIIAKSRDGSLPVTAVTPQTIGKTITYGRRYGLQALIGIAAEEDDDGNAPSIPPSGVPSAEGMPLPTRSEPTTSESGLTEISGKLTNFRPRKYPDGATVFFGQINAWSVWTKEPVTAAALEQAQGSFVSVEGKRSQKRADLFQIINWHQVLEEGSQAE